MDFMDRRRKIGSRHSAKTSIFGRIVIVSLSFSLVKKGVRITMK